MKKSVIVIGGGASGMMAAITAAANGAAVTILEQKEQPGKKLSVTGNGRCNITNTYMDTSCYYSHDPKFVEHFLKEFPVEKLTELFRRIGLIMTERNGGLYPYSQQAQSVVYVLTQALKELNVKLENGVYVKDLRKTGDGLFECLTDHGTFRSQFVVLSAGSQASVKEANAFSAYKILEKLGHHLYPVYPALTNLIGNEGCENDWQGVRAKVAVRYHEYYEVGEVQFTGNGISGIPVFQISRLVIEHLKKNTKAMHFNGSFVMNRDGRKVISQGRPADRQGTMTVPAMVLLDFLPDDSEDTLQSIILEASSSRFTANVKIEDYLRGLLHRKLIRCVLRKASVSGMIPVKDLKKDQISAIVKALKAFPYRINDFGDLQTAQTVQGGLDLSEVTAYCESKLCKGLYITGELLDVDGKCGGYNLHFAFGTGYFSGIGITQTT